MRGEAPSRGQCAASHEGGRLARRRRRGEVATLEERIGTCQDLLRVSNLEGHTERLKDVSGLHLLGEAINVGDGSAVGDDPLASPLVSPAHSTIHFHGRSFDAVMIVAVLGDFGVGDSLSDEAFGLTADKVLGASRASDRDVN